jgi:hypothetical protein
MSASWEVTNALTAKIERAEEHLFKLKVAWDHFVESGSFAIEHRDDTNSGNRIYFLRDVAPIPADIPLIAGDAVHNLRSALDHLAHHLAVVGRGQPGPFGDVSFPIRENETKYKKYGARQILGLRDDAVKAIDGIEPYSGGRGELFWHLHCLDIADKHRLLLTIGSQTRFRSMSPAEIADIREKFLDALQHADPKNDPGLFLKESSFPNFPLKAGSLLDIVAFSEAQENMHFQIELSFGEPRMEGIPVLVVLHDIAYRIRSVISAWDVAGILE